MTDRSKYLGASEAGAVLGLSPYRTPLRVWQEKTGQIVQDPPGIPMRAGNALEALVLDLFTEKTGEAVAFRQAEYSDSANPFLVCHVDGIAGEAICIVSSLVLEAAKAQGCAERLYAPDTGPTAIRDESGQIVAVTRLVGA